MDIYTKFEDINSELDRRIADSGLRQKIVDYLGDEIPEPINENGRFAVLFRHIFTPDYEIESFLSKSKSLDLKPVLFEYTQDKFVAENEDKYALGKLYFFISLNKNGDPNMYAYKIIDFDLWRSKKISDIKTFWEESLVSFHHRILKYFYPNILSSIFDFSQWCHDHGVVCKEYYKKFLSLFLQNTVLFDNFRDSGKEALFLRESFFPAFDLVKRKFGFKPLIYPLQDVDDEDNPKWWGYSSDKKDIIISLAKSSVN